MQGKLTPAAWVPTLCEEGLLIPLTKGAFALIDAADLPLVKRYRWRLLSGSPSYAVGYIPGESRKICFMHKLISGLGPGQQADHANRNSLDNRRSNLRPATPSQNSANTAWRGNAAGYRGVRHVYGRYHAIVKKHGKRRYSPSFATAIEAAQAYDQLAAEAFGEFAVLNFSVRVHAANSLATPLISVDKHSNQGISDAHADR